MLRIISPAKVNLFLGVGPVRADGYHGLVSVFHSLALADEVLIEPAEGLSVHADVALGVAPEQNLAFRAAAAFGALVGREPDVRISLSKRIPHGAGLGGGSSNAAAVVVGLAHMWGIARTDPRCREAAAGLGADVPFFLTGGAALMAGRGDEIVRRLPALVGTPVALVRPPMPVSTAEAYRAFDAAPVAPGDPAAVVSALEAADSAALAVALGNNLGPAASSVVPQVAEALAWVRQTPGVRGAIVAGSGSAVFALCDDCSVAAALCEDAQAHGFWAKQTELAAHGASVLGEGAQ